MYQKKQLYQTKRFLIASCFLSPENSLTLNLMLHHAKKRRLGSGFVGQSLTGSVFQLAKQSITMMT